MLFVFATFRSISSFFMLNQTLGPACELSIDLTLVRAADGNPSCTIRVQAAQMITYDQQIGFTRLRLTKGRVLEVREGTDQIDRLVRGAAADPAGKNHRKTSHEYDIAFKQGE